MICRRTIFEKFLRSWTTKSQRTTRGFLSRFQGHDAFLKKQALTEAELLQLIEGGRLKIVSTQAEERLNLKFLEAAAERNPAAIIGRRTTAALLIADIVQTSDAYQLARPSLRRGIGELVKFLSAQTKLSPSEITHVLMWPVEARRNALLPMLDQGSKGIAAIGLAPFIARQFKQHAGKDIQLETLVISERVHIGHALNATVFPGRHEPPGLVTLMNIMADALNFYRSFNTRVAASWVGNEDRKAAGKLAMPALPLFEFDPRVPLAEFLDATRFASTRSKGRALFGRLSELSDEQRDAEIERLETELRKRLRASETLISFENLDTLASIGSVLFQVVYPPLAGLRALGSQLKEAARKFPAIDRLIDDLAQDLFSTSVENREIDFLSRINRVATFKKDRVS